MFKSIVTAVYLLGKRRHVLPFKLMDYMGQYIIAENERAKPFCLVCVDILISFCRCLLDVCISLWAHPQTHPSNLGFLKNGLTGSGGPYMARTIRPPRKDPRGRESLAFICFSPNLYEASSCLAFRRVPTLYY